MTEEQISKKSSNGSNKLMLESFDGEDKKFDFSITYFLEFWGSVREKIREIALQIIYHPFFDRFILFVILLNTAFLAVADYNHVDNANNLSSMGSTRNLIIIQSEVYFTAIFTTEFILKWCALSLFNRRGSYFSDTWNWLDFLVVVSSLLSLAPNIPDVSVLRTFRVLRPLKSLRSLPGVADIVEVYIYETLTQLYPLQNFSIIVIFL